MEIDVDFAAAEAFDDQMPERCRWLRENDPVFWSEKTEAFIITRFDDVVHVSKNNDLFCSGEGVLPGKVSPKIGMIDEDEPRHGGDAQPDQSRLHPPHGEACGRSVFQADHRRGPGRDREPRMNATSSRTSRFRCR